MVLTILLCAVLKMKIKVVRQSQRDMVLGVFGQMFACAARDEQLWGHHYRVPRAMSPTASQLCCLWGPFPGGNSEDLAGTEPQEHIQYTQGFG